MRSGSERHCGAGMCSEKGNEPGGGSGGQVFWGVAQGAGDL